jgi:hypothetical protein
MSLDDTRAETTHDCFIFISSFLLYGLRPLQTQGVARSMPLVVDPSSLLSQPVFALLCFTPISSALQHIVISPGRRARLLFFLLLLFPHFHFLYTFFSLLRYYYTWAGTLPTTTLSRLSSQSSLCKERYIFYNSKISAGRV